MASVLGLASIFWNYSAPGSGNVEPITGRPFTTEIVGHSV